MKPTKEPVADVPYFENPENLSVEQAFLGGILIDPKKFLSLNCVETDLTFAEPKHQNIWKAIYKVLKEIREPDLVAVNDMMARMKCADMPYLMDLTAATPTSYNIAQHLDLLKKISNHQRIHQIAEIIQEKARNGNNDPVELIKFARESLEQSVVVGCDVKDIFDEDFFPSAGEKSIINTRFKKLNEIYQFVKGDFCVIGADTSYGKSALGLNLATDWALDGYKVFYQSCEMLRDNLWHRILANITDISYAKIRFAYYHSDSQAYKEVKETVAEMWPTISTIKQNLKVYDRSSKPHEIYNLVKAAGYPDICVIDYLQRLDYGTQGKNEASLSEASWHLKNIAQSSIKPCVMVALTQLTTTRDAKGAVTGKVTKYAKAIEEDSDSFIEIERKGRDDPEATLKVHKNRNGRAGVEVKMKFDGEHMRFKEL